MLPPSDPFARLSCLKGSFERCKKCKNVLKKIKGGRIEYKKVVGYKTSYSIEQCCTQIRLGAFAGRHARTYLGIF
jgi:hypothetical protein